MPIVPVNRASLPNPSDPLRHDIVPRRRTPPPSNDRVPPASSRADEPPGGAVPSSDDPPPRKAGKGNPPIEHQYKPGQSGNPKGRPKGARGVVPLVREMMNMKQTVVMGGEERRMTRREALLHKRYERAMTKSEHSADYLLNKDQAGEPVVNISGPQAPPIDDALNQAIINAFLAMTKMGEPIQPVATGGDHGQA
ncbi:MAG: DUF5681 domain-containing protein [Sphingomonadaceae bacterium]